MAVPLLTKKIVKKRVKQFKRPQWDRKICVKEKQPKNRKPKGSISGEEYKFWRRRNEAHLQKCRFSATIAKKVGRKWYFSDDDDDEERRYSRSSDEEDSQRRRDEEDDSQRRRYSRSGFSEYDQRRRPEVSRFGFSLGFSSRPARRLYVGGLPPTANQQTIRSFFSRVMAAIGGNSAGLGDAVVNVYIDHERKFAFVEMRTVEEASNAMALDGVIFEGVSLRVRRPHTRCNWWSRGYICSGLPYYFTEGRIRKLLESFGHLCRFDLVKDRDTGSSEGY